MFWPRASAILLSIFWGFYGLNYEKNKIEKSKMRGKNLIRFWREDPIEAFGIFLSEFIGSFAGWFCLYILIRRFLDNQDKLGSFDIFLGTIAVLGITGYAHRLVDAINKACDE